MKANASKSAVQEIYQLPSKGLLYKQYGDDFTGEVTIRSMTTFEEKNRLGSQGFWQTMVGILNSVVVSPANFNAEDMTLFDFYFLMYKMRTVSYGPTYKVSITCPHCGKSIISNVNLDEIPVKYLPDDFKEPFEIGKLPRSGDVLTCRLTRVRDTIADERKAKDILRDYPDYVGDPEYILKKVSRIVRVNGDELLPPILKSYVEEMQALDSTYFDQAYDHYTGDYGMDITCHDVCSSCGGSIDFALPFNSEFFRPTFDF